MNRIKARSLSHLTGMRLFALGSLLAIVAGCADPFNAADDAQWYSARVVRVSTPSELDDSINRRCVEGLAPMPEQVAVVTVQMHRAPHLAAFAIPSLATVQEKDRVAVNFRLCRLRPSAN